MVRECERASALKLSFSVCHFLSFRVHFFLIDPNELLYYYLTSSYYLLVIPLSIFFSLVFSSSFGCLLLRFRWYNLKVQYLNKDKDWFCSFFLPTTINWKWNVVFVRNSFFLQVWKEFQLIWINLNSPKMERNEIKNCDAKKIIEILR